MASDDVLVVVRQTGRGLASGAEAEMMLYGLWTVRKGKVRRAVWFSNRDEALESVGLSE